MNLVEAFRIVDDYSHCAKSYNSDEWWDLYKSNTKEGERNLEEFHCFWRLLRAEILSEIELNMIFEASNKENDAINNGSLRLENDSR